MLPPLINDISTDRDDPPQYLVAPPRDGRYDAARLAGPTARAYGDLANLHLPLAPDEAFARVQALVARRGWRVAAVDAASRRIQAVAVTPWLRFRDDVAVEVRPHEGGSEVAVRSRSRLGTGDLGANARRIRAFLRELQPPPR